MGEWVPTSERLPDFGKEVVITSVCRWAKDGVMVEVATCNWDYSRHTVYWKTKKDIIGNNLVKAWMDFPQPYKEET